MAHHQRTNYDRMQAAQSCTLTNDSPASTTRPAGDDDEVSADADEPPDKQLRFPRIFPSFKRSSQFKKDFEPFAFLPQNRKASLLTQALLTSPELTPSSDAEAPVLTSDGGLTSPARTNSPSPPLPATHSTGLAAIASKSFGLASQRQNEATAIDSNGASDGSNREPVTELEAGLGRKRCIKFACGRQEAPKPGPPITTSHEPNNKKSHGLDLRKRPFTLKFVCPMRPSAKDTRKQSNSSQAPNLSPVLRRSPSIPEPEYPDHQDLGSTIRNNSTRSFSGSPKASRIRKFPVSDDQSSKCSEATRFCEFAGQFTEDEEWIHEQTNYNRKLTVNDTLQKENAIRRLGEEAEEEARDEDLENEETYCDLEDPENISSSDESVSDAGNETDDEEGFAESDEDSDVASDYQFWTPGLTTAATSTDQLEHIRPTNKRVSSESSIESMIKIKEKACNIGATERRARKATRTHCSKMRPGTPDLPDSTDFVCGTLDEDRPLEAAYMSCLEERRRSKHRVIPQDIDPSFPSSEPELEEDSADVAALNASDEAIWVTGKLDKSDEERALPQRRTLSRRNTKSPMPSPKRLRSPPPHKRLSIHQSPTNRAVVGIASSGRSSGVSSHSEEGYHPSLENAPICPRMGLPMQSIAMPHLPLRPQLTHTTSLPRTPNPFWTRREEKSHPPSAATSPKSRAPEFRGRGPIDIVEGLEKKRQRRKEKFWRQHYRNGGKEKERRCQPGKGAERMRELGLEMAGRNKACMPKADLVLSI